MLLSMFKESQHHLGKTINKLKVFINKQYMHGPKPESRSCKKSTNIISNLSNILRLIKRDNLVKILLIVVNYNEKYFRKSEQFP